MDKDAFSKSFFDLEAIIKKEAKKECSEAEKDAKEAKEKIVSQRYKLDSLLKKLSDTSEK